MTAALAGLSGICAVVAMWDIAAAFDRVRLLAAISSLLAPARAAGRTGRPASDRERRRLAVVATTVAALAGAVLAGPAGALALAVAGPAVAALSLGVRRRRWQRRLAAGAAPALLALADALAGGHGLAGALAVAARDGALTRPARHALASAAGAVDLGAPVADALGLLRAHAGPGTWDVAVAAMLVQREAGGDLATLLRSLAEGAERTARDAAEARAASTQARLTARIVLGLPILAGAMLVLAAPGAAAAMVSEPLPAALLAAAAGLQAVALLAVRRIGGRARS